MDKSLEMKHHKVHDVWKHKPDALPIEDGACMGPKRKRGPLEKLSKKHLWDKAHQAQRELLSSVTHLALRGIPKTYETGPLWVSAECDLATWNAERIGDSAVKLSGLILEIERRM